MDTNKYYELYNLANHFNIPIDTNKHAIDYLSLEEKITYYFDNYLFSLYHEISTEQINYKILKKFSNKHLLSLCRYFDSINKNDYIIKNNTISKNSTPSYKFDKEETKFILFTFTINFVYYKLYNHHITNESGFGKFIFCSGNQIRNYNLFHFRKKYTLRHDIQSKLDLQYNYVFYTMCEKITLFITLCNSKFCDYDLPFDLIIYMIIGSPKFVHLFY